MRGSVWLSAALFAGVLAIACQTPSTGASEENICTPGAYVFCRCADRTKGTKLCQDGKTFGQCAPPGGTVGENGQCAGGEIPDPDSGKDVDGNGDVKPDPVGDDDDATTTPDGPGQLDVCPGKPVGIPPGQTIILEGDTSRAVNDRRGKDGACGAGASGARDFIYRLTPSGSGTIAVKVTGQGALDPIVYVRTTCDDQATQAQCGPQSGTKIVQTSVRVVNGKDYFLYIDGASGGSGAYKAELKLTTGTFCGDGQVDDGEACDDTNNSNGDGCNQDCRGVDGDPATAGTCTGQPLTLWPGKTVNGKGSTSPFGNTFATPSSACDPTGKNTFSDHVYKVTPKGTGVMTVTLTPTPPAGDTTETDPNLMLSAHATCDAAAATPPPSTKCENNGTGSKPETMTVNVTKDTPVFISVDGGGLTKNKGAYSISFKL